LKDASLLFDDSMRSRDTGLPGNEIVQGLGYQKKDQGLGIQSKIKRKVKAV